MAKNVDSLTGSNSVNSEAAGLGRTIIEFEEASTSFKFIDNGDGERGVGDTIKVGANLSDPDTGEVIATKEATYTAIKQRGNGNIIAQGEETITFLDDGDKIFTSGKFSQTDNEAGETNKLRIVGGTGDFENAKGFEFFTQIGDAGAGSYDGTLFIVGTPDSI